MLLALAVYLLIGLAAVGWAALCRRCRFSQPIAWAGALCLAGAMLAWMWHVSEPGKMLSDFRKAYFPAGSAVVTDPDQLYGEEVLFVNIPIFAYLFTPLTWLPRRAASALVLLSGLACIPLAATLLVRLTKASGANRWLIWALCIANGPLINSVREGNTTHFVLLMLIAASFAFEKKRDGVAGMWLALAAVIKLPLLLIGLWLLARRLWKATAAYAGTLALIAGASVLRFGWDLHQRWYEQCVRPFSQHPLGAFNVQSIDGMLVRFFTGATHLYDWLPIQDIDPAFFFWKKALAIALVAAVAVCLVRAGQRPVDSRGNNERVEELGIVLTAALILSPLSWTHYYLLLLLPIAWLITRHPEAKQGATAASLGLAALLVSLPVVMPEEGLLPAQPLAAALASSVYVCGALLLLALLLRQRAASGSGRAKHA